MSVIRKAYEYIAIVELFETKEKRIFTITEFIFSERDPNKYTPVSLYATNKGKGDSYLGAFKTITEAKRTIDEYGNILEEETRVKYD